MTQATCTSESVFVQKTENGIAPVLHTGECPAQWKERLMAAFGVKDEPAATYLLHCLSRTAKGKRSDLLFNACIATIREIRPNNSLERMLVVQMCLANEYAVNALSSSDTAVFAEDKERLSAIAAKMMRLYLQQFEVLRRYRNAGRQNIQVTHVYADQAIVGDVVQGGNKNG